MGRWLLTRHPGGTLGDWRRSVFLVLFGVIHVIYGMGFLNLGPTVTQVDALAIPLAIAEFVGIGTGSAFIIAGWVWVGTGTLGALAGIIPPGRDGWGFVILASLEALWASSYFASWLVLGNPRGWAAGVVFVAIGAAVVLMSGCVSADRVRHEGKSLALLPPDEDDPGLGA